jgi:hypothetical protein
MGEGKGHLADAVQWGAEGGMASGGEQAELEGVQQRLRRPQVVSLRRLPPPSLASERTVAQIAHAAPGERVCGGVAGRLGIVAGSVAAGNH